MKERRVVCKSVFCIDRLNLKSLLNMWEYFCYFFLFLWLPKHILTAAECGVTNKQRVRSQAKRTDGMSGIEWCFACNIFVLTGYDSRSKALNDNRTLSRTKTFTPHEKAFQNGYRYNIGKETKPILSGWPICHTPPLSLP